MAQIKEQAVLRALNWPEREVLCPTVSVIAKF